jgi:hypothetical protein
MNGFKDQNLDEDSFGPVPGNIVSAFDAFRMLYPCPQAKQNTSGVLETDNFLVSSQPNRNLSMSPGPRAAENGPSQ